MIKFVRAALFSILFACHALFAAHATPEIIEADMYVTNAQFGFGGAKNAFFSLIKESKIAMRMKIDFETPLIKISKDMEVDTILYDDCGCLHIVSGESNHHGARFSLSLFDSSACIDPNHDHGFWRVSVRSGVGWSALEDSRLEIIGIPNTKSSQSF